jgi:hypothetical protein
VVGFDPIGEEEAKFGQVPRFRCSEAVRDGFEAEKADPQREQRKRTETGRPVSGHRASVGSRWAQYHAPFPFTALARTSVSPSYRRCAARAVASSPA